MHQNPATLNDKKVFLLDMDGTLYNEEQLFPDVGPFLDYLKLKKIRYFFLTNNSSKSTKGYVDKLRRLGLKRREGKSSFRPISPLIISSALRRSEDLCGRQIHGQRIGAPGRQRDD
jgi:ribonucleotide monophosphatase NagD (HAD superfamily)